jgi:hypothetical protein
LTKGTQSGEDQTRVFTSRLYLDSATFLPLAGVTTGSVDMGKKYPLLETTTYGHTFIPTSSVAPNFFTPASIGYHGAADEINQELAPVPSTFMVYWLGVHFRGPFGLPDLVASRAVPSPSGVSDFILEVYYTLASDPYGFPRLFMEESTTHFKRFPRIPAPRKAVRDWC